MDEAHPVPVVLGQFFPTRTFAVVSLTTPQRFQGFQGGMIEPAGKRNNSAVVLCTSNLGRGAASALLPPP